MNLGEVQLIAPYSADSQRVQVNDLSGFQIKSEIVPSRATIYSRADLSVHTTYLVTALGGSSIALGGVIEGIELPGHRFCLGVQWHPEYFVTDADRKIFEAFITACRKD